MNSTSYFQKLIHRVRAGDQAAATELMQLYEPHVRRAIRLRMRDRGLRQFLDSTDISQSVMGNFFVHLQSGDFVIESPAQLIALLVRMAQNRVTDWVRHGRAMRNDYRRQISLTDADQVSRDCDDPVATEVVTTELMTAVRQRLTPLERRLLERRIDEHSWQEIAEIEGASADALRVQLRRSLNRIAVDLGILEPS